MITPSTPISEEYFRYFRQECRRYGISIAAVETTNALVSDDELVEVFTVLRDAGADALACLGYGGMVVSGTCQRALQALNWDPPRIMTTAFMQYIWGFEKLEGWDGIDRLGSTASSAAMPISSRSPRTALR